MPLQDYALNKQMYFSSNEKNGGDQDTESKKENLSKAEAKKAYQSRYRLQNKDKEREYQRRYNLIHKKKAKSGRGKSSFQAAREVVKMTFNISDIMSAPVEKSLKMLEKILKGERRFTM